MATSLVTVFGTDNYELHHAIDESYTQGMARRVPPTFIPEGMIIGESKIFGAHPHAIVVVRATDRTLYELAEELALGDRGGKLYTELYESHKIMQEDIDSLEAWAESRMGESPVECPYLMTLIAYELSKSPNRSELIKKYGIEFYQGIFGYSPFTGFRLVLANNVTELPKEYEHLLPAIEAGIVQVSYVRYKDEEKK